MEQIENAQRDRREGGFRGPHAIDDFESKAGFGIE
jgi:hypothetical protein